MTSGTTVGNPVRAKLNEGYPALSREAVGALKLLWRLSEIEDDWSKGGKVHDAWDRWTYWPYMAKFTYNLTFAIRALAKIAQEVPAWRDVISASAGKITDRMRFYVAWYDWVEQPGLDPNRASYPYFYYKHTMPPGTGGWYNAPGYAGNGLPVTMHGIFQSLLLAPVTPNPVHPYTYQHSPGVGRTFDPDPIRAHGSSNMMYKGYYIEQLAHCKAISGESRWDGPFHLVYDDEIQFTYTAEQISQTLYDQFMSPSDPGGSSMQYGIDCEVGKVFPLCVGVAGLGMQLLDALNGTNHSAGYEKWLEFGKTWIAGGAESEGGFYTWAACYYDRDLNVPLNRPENQMPCFWTTVAMNSTPFDRQYAKRLNDSAIAKFGRYEDGALRLVFPPEIMGEMVVDDPWGIAFAMACAHELGDIERLKEIRAWVDRAWEPTFKDGEYYYAFNLNEPWPRGIINHVSTLSQVGEPGSFARMINEPNTAKFSQPTLCDVDYPNVTVRQAYYDAPKQILAIAIVPGQDSSPIGTATQFRIANVGSKELTVTEDGEKKQQWTRTTKAIS